MPHPATKKKEHITLKEAAELSGYSADYLGQLIRQGKLFGEQVYCNVAWVTTRDEVLRYMAEVKGEGKKSPRAATRRRAAWREMCLRSVLLVIIVSLIIFITFLVYLLMAALDQRMEQRQLRAAETSAVPADTD